MRIVKKIIYSFVYAIGFVVSKANKACAYYMNSRINHQLGGGKRTIQYPYRISGLKNLLCSDNVNIGKDSVIMCTGSKVVIKSHFVSGPGLKIIAGDHMAVVGMFLDTVSDAVKEQLDKDHVYDQDVIIEEDVWAGANVTILKGVTIGRGCIIAAGSIVNKSIPPYCIAAGIPAKPIKMRWSKEQILQHESILYKEEDRLSNDILDNVKIHLDTIK